MKPARVVFLLIVAGFYLGVNEALLYVLSYSTYLTLPAAAQTVFGYISQQYQLLAFIGFLIFGAGVLLFIQGLKKHK